VLVHVAFTPGEQTPAPIGIVVDVLRATSTMTQAIAAGYRRVLCCAEIDEARALAETEGPAKLAGERRLEAIPGFDFGNSPREVAEKPDVDTLILSTTNGTRTILAAAERCEEVVLGSLLNLSAVAEEARGRSADVAIFCAGFKGSFALDDAYCAGRIIALLGAERSDAAIAAGLVAQSFGTALEALNAWTYGPPGLEQDILFCSRESVLPVVPRLSGMVDVAAEIVP